MNNNDDLRDNVILPARTLIRDDTKIKKFFLFPALLSITFLTAMLSYQTIYTYVVIFGNQRKALEKILYFLESKYAIEAIIIFIIFVLLYMFLVPVFQGGLIKYIDFKNKGQTIGRSDIFGQGLNKFLPFFEYGNLFSEFKTISILNFFLFTLRFVGVEYIKYIAIFYIIVFFLGTILNILFIYSEYSIILGRKLVFSAIGESCKITILNLKMTIRLYFMLFMFNFRVFINIILFLFFPVLIVAAIIYISSKFIMLVTVGLLSIIFIMLIILAAYLTSVLDIFKTALWYYAYEEGRKKIEDEN